MKYLITESQFMGLALRRNLGELPNYIRSSYKWLSPPAFNSFEEYLDRVIFSSTRDYVSDFIGKGVDYETYDSISFKFMQYVSAVVINEYYDEIFNHYKNYKWV